MESPTQFEEECLAEHNRIRAIHGAPPLVLDRNLSDFAEEWAKVLLQKNTMEHREGHNYGENIYMASGKDVDGTIPVQAWYKEIKDYNFKKALFSPNTGHFTQLVWKNTTKLGVGRARSCLSSKCSDQENFESARAIAFSEPPMLQLSQAKAIAISEPQIPELFFENECLAEHNRLRARHGCPPLQLNYGLCRFAGEWAQYLADHNEFRHRPNNQFGENLYWASGSNVTGEDVVDNWYNEIKFYDFDHPGFSEKTGHFTQVVWKSSRRLGVAIARRGSSTWVVANYDPPGNYSGQFKDNVPRPRF
ncbi:unnamed protein product [Hermetia illucens]|uniref:SCP domain-containing protein n=1 Tax=Hermetia illucens TaxID=343691 RepID=A0A7R8UAC1_HERIL|nr:unnamed protein product [Hermetia illucens]